MALPASLALTSIVDSSLAVAADVRNDFTAVQTAVNGLITYLTGVSVGGVAGRVNSDATTAAGAGFSAVHTSTGVYTVTFSPVFAAIPVVLVGAVGTSGGFALFADVYTVTASGFVVGMIDRSLNPIDAAFHLFARLVS